MGVILPVFNLSGNTPWFIQSLYNLDKCSDKTWFVFFRTCAGMSDAFPFSNSLIIFATSELVQSVRKILDSQEGGR